MKKIHFLVLLFLLGCNNIGNIKNKNSLDSSRENSTLKLEQITEEKELPYSEKNIDSILKTGKKNYPILICKEKDIEFKIFSYGEIGEYAGLYSEAELASKVYYLKILKNEITIDSLEIYKKEMGEGVFRIKTFNFLENKRLNISVFESWEDTEMGKESVIDSLHIYKIKENGKIEILSKQETKRIIQ